MHQLRWILTLLYALALGGMPLKSAAADDIPQLKGCLLSSTEEPTEGRCRPVLQDKLCFHRPPGGGSSSPYCVPRASDCAMGDSSPSTGAIVDGPTHFCYGRALNCPKADNVVSEKPGKCFVYARVKSKGGAVKDVTSAGPACSTGGGDVSTCQWMCMKPPPGKKVSTGTVEFLARDENSTCSEDKGYLKFDPSVCGTPGTVGNCAPSYYDWDVRKVSEDEVCGRVKNWSHNTARCAAITFEVK